MNIFKSTLKVLLRWMSSNYEQKEFMHFEYKSLFRHVICKFFSEILAFSLIFIILTLKVKYFYSAYFTFLRF